MPVLIQFKLSNANKTASLIISTINYLKYKPVESNITHANDKALAIQNDNSSKSIGDYINIYIYNYVYI